MLCLGVHANNMESLTGCEGVQRFSTTFANRGVKDEPLIQAGSICAFPPVGCSVWVKPKKELPGAADG